MDREERQRLLRECVRSCRLSAFMVADLDILQRLVRGAPVTNAEMDQIERQLGKNAEDLAEIRRIIGSSDEE